MRITTLLADAAQTLARAGVSDAALDARLLLQHLTGLSRSQLVLRGDATVDEQILATYLDLIAQRSQRIPLQYLTASQEFWSLDFVVSPAVLIPRPETEFLLECVLARCTQSPQRPINHALDICTGSGVIAVVLAKELCCQVVALDISESALQVAQTNFVRHGLPDRIMPICTDLFAGLGKTQKFDLIVSNPPYIAEEEINQLEPEVCLAEPRLALSGGANGMDCIQRIITDAQAFLQPGAWLFCEIGADQKQAIEMLFARPQLQLQYSEVSVLDDWAGKPRVLQARYTPR
jgi:release factor glutamine methyltransferase